MAGRVALARSPGLGSARSRARVTSCPPAETHSPPVPRLRPSQVPVAGSSGARSWPLQRAADDSSGDLSAPTDQGVGSNLHQMDAPAVPEQGVSVSGGITSTVSVPKFAGSHPTFGDLGTILCLSPPFHVTAQVSVPPAMANGDLTVGFMQALTGCTGPRGHYWAADDTPYMTAFEPFRTLPLRDADPNGIFYGPEAQKDISAPSVSVSMDDRPQSALPWNTPDGKGRLEQIVGQHNFISWLVVKSDSTKKVNVLRYLRWSIGWFAGVDPVAKSAISFDVGRVEIGEGSGPMPPIFSGPVANDSVLPYKWDKWQ